MPFLFMLPGAICSTLVASWLWNSRGNPGQEKISSARIVTALWAHGAICLTMATQICIGFTTVVLGIDCSWYPSAASLFLYTIAVLLLTNDLLLKISALQERTRWTRAVYLVCLAADVTAITWSAIRTHFHYRAPAVDFTHLASTFLRAALSIAILLLAFPLYHEGAENYPPILDASTVGPTHNYGTVECASSKAKGHQQEETPRETVSQSSQLRGLLQYVWQSKPRRLQALTVFCFFLEAIQRVINIEVPRALGAAVTALQDGLPPWKYIVLFAVYRAASGKTGVIGALRSQLWIPISQNTYRSLTLSVFEWVMNLSLRFHLTEKLGVIMSAMSKTGAVDLFLDFLLFSLIPVILDIVIAIVYFLLYFDYVYATVVVATCWAYVCATIYVAFYRGTARRRMVDQSQQLNAIQTEAVMAYEAVHLNSAIDLELARLGASVDKYLHGEYAVLASLNGLNAAQNLIFSAGLLAVGLVCAYRIRQNTHTVADFVTVITYMIQLQAPLGFLGSVYSVVQNSMIDSERLMSLFRQAPTVVDSDSAIDMKTCTGSVKFSNVTFSYEPGRPVIKDFNLEIRPGQSVAIVGESGSGKSTLLRLLLRFYDVDQGSIQIDGVDIRDMTMKSLRRLFGVVPQEATLYNDSIMYNLLYAKADADPEAVYQACKNASIHQKIESLPRQYDTLIGERGLKLSGGERQRIAIARAILRSPNIILLDEATSSLDLETEKQIQESLESVCRSRTSITIAHRLSTVANCDVIIVLQKGRVVESGSHEELLSLKGIYWKLWKKQIRK